MIKNVLFDLDGTLIKSVDIILETYHEVMKTYFKDVDMGKEDVTAFLGYPLVDSFKKYTNDLELIDEVINQYRIRTKERMTTELEAYPNAKKIIEWLKNKKIKVGIVTSKTKSVALENLKTVGLNDMFDCFIGMEDCLKHKPDPEGILKALDILNAKKEETVYIGDHENDIIAAKKAGVLSCGVTYSYRLSEVLAAMPDFVIDELSNIKDLI